MNCYILATNHSLYPLNDPPARWRILDRPLGELQAELLKQHGLKPVPTDGFPADADPHVIMSDALYLEPEALQAFLEAAKATGHSVQAHAAPGLFADRVLWHMRRDEQGRVPLPLWYVLPGNPPAPLALVLDEEVYDAPMPAHMGTSPDKGLETLLTRRVIIEIENWVNLQHANMQALFARGKRAKHLPWWRGLWAFLRGRGNLYGTMSRLNKIGKNCDIHPTAVVELCELGDGVRIGAHAVVRMSVVGPGAMIDDHASVRASVIGAGASIANNNNVLMCVVYPRAFLISGPYQFSLFGAECAIMHCICCDTRLDGRTVSAEIGPGQSVDSRQRYLGSCYGHGVRAGAGTITAPGRAIPNELFFLPHPDLVVARIDADLPPRKNLFTQGGGLTFRGRPPAEVTLVVPETTPEHHGT